MSVAVGTNRDTPSATERRRSVAFQPLYWYARPMQIIRIPKTPTGATVARLKLSRGSQGRVQASFEIESRMSASMEQREYESAEEAEGAAIAYAEQRRAVCLIIEDDT